MVTLNLLQNRTPTHYPPPTLADYKNMIFETHCRDCGHALLSSPIQTYPHDAGWTVQGYEEKQWLYITCPGCGYEWALWKLGVPRD